MSTETSKWQILSFCNALRHRYSFIAYATLPLVPLLFLRFSIDLVSVDVLQWEMYLVGQ
jgi:hypothetical protein